mmetsp:Transcript_26982/g.37668  ORF Transcript_26982/g.37668 Transcript_26982/m.37668 type:complete len:314 (+) Transcript_26982:2-943(+)
MVFEAFMASLATFVAIIIYLPTLLWHKVGVFIAGRHVNRLLSGSTPPLRIPILRLIGHDWSKFQWAELSPYSRYWFESNLRCNLLGRIVSATAIPRYLRRYIRCSPGEWKEALHHHHSRMDHHAEYFLINGGAIGQGERDGGGERMTKFRSKDSHSHASDNSSIRRSAAGVVVKASSPQTSCSSHDDATLEMVADLLGAQWGYDGSWPKPKEWDRLGKFFHSTGFPSARSKALFFAVFCALGYEDDLADDPKRPVRGGDRKGRDTDNDGEGVGNVRMSRQKYCWKHVEEELGSALTRRLRAISNSHGQSSAKM